MTSSDDDYGQTSNNNNITNRRMNNNSNNPYSASNVEIRILMTSRDAGAVIGKSGVSIQKLRADHPRTTIQVPDCSSSERVLIINGDQDQAYDALYKIIPSLIDSSRLSSFNRRRNATNNANGDQPQSNNSNNDVQSTSEIRLLVNQMYCGAIIGKGGQHIKELRQTHNLDIKVFSQCCPMSSERVISLRGKSEDIIQCIKNIFNTISTSPQQSRGSHLGQYDPHNSDAYAVNEYGGFPAATGVENRPGYNSRTPYVASGPRGGLGARYPAAALLTSTRVTLPNELVGAVIGPRGAKIQQIRQITHANIIIDDKSIPSSTGNGGDRIITIEGTPEQISYAQTLLQQAVRQSGLWRP